MIKVWTDAAWQDYVWWLDHDRKTLKRINRLLQEVERTPFEGIGKPEPLKGNLAGLWSRRITIEDRLVYSVEGDRLFIYSAKDHYA
jgi:toxin YoeB